jgi:hypothetical protein
MDTVLLNVAVPATIRVEAREVGPLMSTAEARVATPETRRLFLTQRSPETLTAPPKVAVPATKRVEAREVGPLMSTREAKAAGPETVTAEVKVLAPVKVWEVSRRA